MNQPMDEVFEDYVSGKATPQQRAAVEAELGRSETVRVMLADMQEHAQWMRALRLQDEVEPLPGFYARVVARIDAQRPVSLWTFFLDPFFGKRLMYASLALLAILATVAISGEQEVSYASNSPVGVIAAREYPPTPGIDQHHDRDVVLVNLATWGGGSAAEEVEFLPAASQ